MRHLPIGAGTKVDRHEPVIEIREKQPTKGVTWVRITQTIELTVEVPCCPGPLHSCGICRTLPPLPHGKNAAEYILENNDGQRICFPEAEDVKPERDGYPVAGWRHIQLGDLSVFACGECIAHLKETAEQRKKDVELEQQP